MRILYGIQGTGNGHVTRSTRLIDCLQTLGAAVSVVFSGCDADKVYEKDVIKDPIFCKGFTFKVKNGEIKFAATAGQLNPLRYIREVLCLDVSGFDRVITDFEPVTAMAARLHGVPSIGIGHQYAFHYDIPMEKNGKVPLMITRYFAPARIRVGMHWHHFNQPIVPPVLPKKLNPGRPVDPGLILVYLPFEWPSQIKKLLEGFKEFKFAVYAGDRSTMVRKDGHITWHPFSKINFYNDLSACSGVICNAGFELPSEALHLGKKLLVKPLKGQYEQVCNALALKQLGYGRVMPELDSRVVGAWLKDNKKYRTGFPDVARPLAEWILDNDRGNRPLEFSRFWRD